MNQECPSFERACCIGNDPILLGEISSLYNKERHYFSVMDEPRLEREDAQNEVIRRNNSIARIRPEVIIYAGVSEESKREFSSRLPSRLVLEISSTEEIDSKLPSRICFPREVLRWGPQRLAVGLLLAKQTGKRLKIDMEQSPAILQIEGSGGHVVVFEDRTDVAPVIVANYAYSIGAGLITISEVSEDLIDEINEEFYTIYTDEGFEPLKEKLTALRSKLRILVGEMNLKFIGGLTFVTNGIPFGFAFDEVPATHVFAYPDLGVHLVNAIAAEQPKSPGIRVSLLIEPGESDSSEIKEISDTLREKGGFVRILAEGSATVFNAHQNIELYPYDLLVISTHADETSGRRVTYQFTDRHGCQHEITVDEGVGFGYDPAIDKVLVSTYERFISLDGVPWDDSEGKSKIKNIGVALLDFIEIKQKDIKSLKIIETKELKRVKGCMALKMVDHNYLPSPHGIADINSPIIMNNACSSWHELSKRFTFAGARAYMGTMFPITGIEASEIGRRLFASHLEEPLAFALWRVQNEVYGKEMRRPYVMVGPHFTKIHISQIHVPNYLTRRLSISIKRWQKKSESHPEEEIRTNAKKAKEFLEKELREHIKRWYGPKI